MSESILLLYTGLIGQMYTLTNETRKTRGLLLHLIYDVCMLCSLHSNNIIIDMWISKTVTEWYPAPIYSFNYIHPLLAALRPVIVTWAAFLVPWSDVHHTARSAGSYSIRYDLRSWFSNAIPLQTKNTGCDESSIASCNNLYMLKKRLTWCKSIGGFPSRLLQWIWLRPYPESSPEGWRCTKMSIKCLVESFYFRCKAQDLKITNRTCSAYRGF